MESLEVRENIGEDECMDSNVGSDHEEPLKVLLRILDFILNAVRSLKGFK